MKFQSMKPFIRTLYEEMEELLWRTMSKLSSQSIYQIKQKMTLQGKPQQPELLVLDVYNKKKKPIKMIDIGTKAKSLFLPSPLELDENVILLWSIPKRLLILYEINNGRSSKETAIELFLSKLLQHSIVEKVLHQKASPALPSI